VTFSLPVGFFELIKRSAVNTSVIQWKALEATVTLDRFALSNSDLNRVDDASLILLPASFSESWQVGLALPQLEKELNTEARICNGGLQLTQQAPAQSPPDTNSQNRPLGSIALHQAILIPGHLIFEPASDTDRCQINLNSELNAVFSCDSADKETLIGKLVRIGRGYAIALDIPPC